MFINSSKLLESRLCDTSDVLSNCSANLATLTFPMLVRELDHNGVYVFGVKVANAWQPTYVGKASSRLFLERLASHFDTREGAFMNNMLKKIRQRELESGRSVLLREVADEVANSGTIVTIRHSDAKGSRDLETVLRHTLPGIVNAGKKRGYNPLAEWAILGGLC